MIRAATLALPVLSLAFGSPLLAQPTCELPIAGYLTDDAGAALAGTIDVELRFYADPAPDAPPVECRSFDEVEIDRGWMRLSVDACSDPPVGDCGIVPLTELFDGAPGLWVGVSVAGVELDPRIPVGAVPFAVRSSDSDALQGRGPEAFEAAGSIVTHALDPDAHHSSTSDGVEITPSSVTVGDTSIGSGEVDLGPDVDDELTAAIVTTLTGGGEADALHGHAAGDVTGGSCYIAHGTTACADGWTLIHAGYALESLSYDPDDDVDGDDSAAVAVAPYCVDQAAVEITTSGSPMARALVTTGDNLAVTLTGALRCAFCCR